MTTAALILAAGSSSRLGQPKQWVRYAGGTLVENAAAAARDAGYAPIVIVRGAVRLPFDSDRLKELDVVENKQWALGMGESIRCGIHRLIAIRPAIQRVIILACDQPAITSAMLHDFLDHWAMSNKPMSACAYADSLGPPCGFDRSRFDQLLALPPHRGAKSLLGDLNHVTIFDWPAGAFDIDTPKDLDEWQSRLTLSGPVDRFITTP